tara:strand:+ start:1370 stop:3127 length:1758 start_codon:yes stop_codon:yes gene_type:complete
MISEKLKQRIENLTSDSAMKDMAMRKTDPVSPPMKIGEMPMDDEPVMLDAEDMSAEDRETLNALLNRGSQVGMAPMSQLAQELAMQGEGEDTQLAHLRPGEVVLPPEFFEDEQFESAVERKFKEFDIEPEQAIVGTGIASLNPVTGLEQFGFFKKIGKRLKKMAKKIAPIAGPLANFIPGVGPVLAGAIGAATNVAAGKGLKGAISGALGGYGAGKLAGGIGSLGKATTGAAKSTGIFGGTIGPSIRTGIGNFFNPAAGQTGIFGGQLGPNLRRGIGSIFGGGQQGMPSGMADTGDVIGTLDGAPITRADLANMTPDQIANMQMTQAAVQDKTLMQRLSAMFLPQSVEDALGTGPQGGGIFGGGQGQGGGLFGGGFGDALKMGGIGALAAGLGKLAYEDAQKQKGVPLTPLTTMSPTGRYNIEAEIARRMGQPAPNPVEFGLLPAGTIPELSGGKPRGMMYGGGVEDLTGGMVRGLASGGGVMAFAQGGAVQMQEGGEMDPSQFPRMDGDINGPGTETSDDIPAMLSDGEFVMTGRAVRGAGSYEMQADPNGIISLTPTLKEDRERGMNLMYKMMDTFANKAKAS